MKNTRIVTVGNMKGGVGKSTMTSLIANYIHNKTEYTVCVIDSDDMQQTLAEMRESDIRNGALDSELYALISIDSSNFAESISAVLGEFDFIFVDLPGNLKQEGVIQSYSMVDYLLIPTALSDADLNSTVKFHEILKNELLPLRKKANLDTDVVYFLNKINAQTVEFKEFQENKENMEMKFLNTFIGYNIIDFQRNAGTVNTYHKPQYIEFCEEVLKHITA